MPLIPAFEIGIRNAWLFMCIFPLQWLAVALSSPAAALRTGLSREIERSKTERRATTAGMVLWVAASCYSVFLPFHVGTAWFYTGLGFFILGLVALIAATICFVRAPTDRPITGGIFRYSRHPMYLSMFLVYIGVSIAAASWLFSLLTIFTIIMQRRGAIFEEKCCQEIYGDAYRNYMSRTPRWPGRPKPG